MTNEGTNEPMNERGTEPTADSVAGSVKTRIRGLTRGNPNALTREEKRQIRERCAQWKYTDRRDREPSTIKALAKECGVSANTIHAIMSNLPNTLREYIKLRQINSPAHFTAVVDHVLNDHKSNDRLAIKTVRELRKGVTRLRT